MSVVRATPGSASPSPLPPSPSNTLRKEIHSQRRPLARSTPFQDHSWIGKCLLLDLIMPGVDGIATLKRIRDDRHRVKIIVLTGSDDDAMQLLALRLGAHGYVVKDKDPALSDRRNPESLCRPDLA